MPPPPLPPPLPLPVPAPAIAAAAANGMAALVVGRPVATNPAGTSFPGNLCLRALPLSSVISSADVRLNGGSTNVAVNQFSTIYPFLQNDDDIKRYASEMPLQCDTSSKYNTTDATSPFKNVNGNSSIPPRGSFLSTLTTSGVVGGVLVNTYVVRWVEELFISPFLTGHHQSDVGLVNVNNLTISLRLSSLVRLFSSAASTGSIAVSLFGTPDLLVEFCSQNTILATRSPQTAIYSYQQIQTYQQNITSTGVVSLQALRLPCQPSKIFVYVAPTVDGALTTERVPDHFLHITNVSVNFNDKNSLLNQMTESDLYEMSANNAGSHRGAYPSFSQYKYGVGSLIIIDVARDLSVSDSSQAGTQNQFSTLQIQITFDNQNTLYAGQALDITGYSAYQVVVSPGLLYLSPSSAEFLVQGPSPAEVLTLTNNVDSGAVKVPEEGVPDADNAAGGGFSDLLSKGLSLMYDHRDKIMEHAAPHLKKAGEYLHRKIRGGDMPISTSGGMMAISSSAGGYHNRA